MEVCFIKGDYRDFLREHSPEIDSAIGPGWFVSSEGVKLGEHKGFPYYTIGQRKGMEIALVKPAYVLILFGFRFDGTHPLPKQADSLYGEKAGRWAVVCTFPVRGIGYCTRSVGCILYWKAGSRWFFHCFPTGYRAGYFRK